MKHTKTKIETAWILTLWLCFIAAIIFYVAGAQGIANIFFRISAVLAVPAIVVAIIETFKKRSR